MMVRPKSLDCIWVLGNKELKVTAQKQMMSNDMIRVEGHGLWYNLKEFEITARDFVVEKLK